MKTNLFVICILTFLSNCTTCPKTVSKWTYTSVGTDVETQLNLINQIEGSIQSDINTTTSGDASLSNKLEYFKEVKKAKYKESAFNNEVLNRLKEVDGIMCHLNTLRKGENKANIDITTTVAMLNQALAKVYEAKKKLEE
ncbi:hypothetical protein [Chondrinema litorale]|uniref:hypothetical protein n=1 Tax=Chondrinema litorale TaxID=2994555 RepID=UPI0025433417|nr:hypothetical protein [Chondrinema litorale]UZS00086.1 hypothetical protein OQ292_39795 [Chondrinema litorale]